MRVARDKAFLISMSHLYIFIRILYAEYTNQIISNQIHSIYDALHIIFSALFYISVYHQVLIDQISHLPT